MLFDIPFVADWHKIGERRQLLTNRGNQQENAKQIDYDYKVGNKVLVINEGILRKAESAYGKEPWTITTVHTNGTIRIQHGTKIERLSIRREEPFTDNKLRGALPRRHLCTFRILILYYFVPYIMPLCHSAIPPFAIPPFRHSAIPPFCHSTIPPFCSNMQ
jgi:hypothetical protein